jgi:hypothetical protein
MAKALDEALHIPLDPHVALLTLVATKFDRGRLTIQHNWKADVPEEEWSGIVTRVGASGMRELVELNGESPPLLRSLRLAEDLGPALLTSHLVVLKFTSLAIKGNLSAVEGCVSLRTLVLHDTKVRQRPPSSLGQQQLGLIERGSDPSPRGWVASCLGRVSPRPCISSLDRRLLSHCA